MKLPFGALVTIDSIELDEGIGYYVKYKNNHCVDMKDLPKSKGKRFWQCSPRMRCGIIITGTYYNVRKCVPIY